MSAYRVIRDGEPVATTTHTRYSDAELQPDTAYEYRVIALDPAGNASPRRRRPPSGRSGRTRSSSSRATTPRSGRTLPARLTGPRDYLETDNSPLENFLLKFPVTGVGDRLVQSATLRLYALNPSPFGGDFRVVDDNSWNEQTVTWANAPAGGIAPIASLARWPREVGTRPTRPRWCEATGRSACA